MQKREIKAEQKNQTGQETASGAPSSKRAQKMVEIAKEALKTKQTTVFEEDKKDLVVVPRDKMTSDKDTIKKEKKDDGAKYEAPKPKKPSSAYVFFATEQSAKIRAEKNYTVSEAMKAAGAAWNTLSDAEKEKYNKMAKIDHER